MENEFSTYSWQSTTVDEKQGVIDCSEASPAQCPDVTFGESWRMRSHASIVSANTKGGVAND